MELDDLLKQKLINKSVFHPIYGEIGFIKDILQNRQKYIVFKERSVDNLISNNDYLRAIPSKHFYIDNRTSDLMVDFPSEWIKNAPKFTTLEVNDNKEFILQQLDIYYSQGSKKSAVS